MANRIEAQEITVDIPNLRPLPANNTKRAFINPKTKKVVLVDKVKGRAKYLKAIRFHASMAAAREDWNPDGGAVYAVYRFYFQRPKYHMGTGRNAGKAKSWAPVDHLEKPDVINLVKPVEDALTGILWNDDCQAVSVVSEKYWSDQDGVRIIVRRYVPADGKAERTED